MGARCVWRVCVLGGVNAADEDSPPSSLRPWADPLLVTVTLEEEADV